MGVIVVAPETAGLIGVEIPWKHVIEVGMRVDSFSSFSEVANGKVTSTLGGGMPQAVATVELFLNAKAARDEMGADSLFLQLPIEHDDDVLVFYWIFEERGVGDDEEVLATYIPAKGLSNGSKAGLGAAIMPKGTLRRSFETTQRGEPDPDIEPIWIHAPRTPFVKPPK